MDPFLALKTDAIFVPLSSEIAGVAMAVTIRLWTCHWQVSAPEKGEPVYRKSSPRTHRKFEFLTTSAGRKPRPAGGRGFGPARRKEVAVEAQISARKRARQIPLSDTPPARRGPPAGVEVHMAVAVMLSMARWSRPWPRPQLFQIEEQKLRPFPGPEMGPPKMITDSR